MFGCYRRTDAADPGTYVGAVALILTRYSSEVVTAVTDPFGGLPSRKNENGYSGLPDVADVKEACENEAARLLRMAQYRAMPRTNYPRLPPPRETAPGAFANVLVHTGHPKYDAFLARTNAVGTDPRDWKIDERGLHVSLAWIDQPNAQRPVFQQYTADELRRMYPPKPASDSEMSHGKQSGQVSAGERPDGAHDQQDRDQRHDDPENFDNGRWDDEPDRGQHPQHEKHAQHEQA